MPINVTIFASKPLIEELQLSAIIKWTTSLSNKINVKQVNPFKSPEVADHYDITSDGIITFEFDDKRLDVDIIELILINENFSSRTVQNHILKSLIQLTRPLTSPIILLHNERSSMLEDTQPMGLSLFAELLTNNHIPIEERTLPDFIEAPPAHSLLIFNQFGPSAMPFSKEIQAIFENESKFILFSHPKHSTFINQFFLDIQFNDLIIEDESMHILNFPNQLLLQYKTSTNDTLLGVFPFFKLYFSNR